MSILPNGYYTINSVVSPQPYVGADYDRDYAPVVVLGEEHVWKVRRAEDGAYTITLAKTQRVSKAEGDQVIVTNSTRPFPDQWALNQYANAYTIEVPFPTPPVPPLGWTITGTNRGDPVKLEPITVPPGPTTYQLWLFQPVEYSEEQTA